MTKKKRRKKYRLWGCFFVLSVLILGSGFAKWNQSVENPKKPLSAHAQENPPMLDSDLVSGLLPDSIAKYPEGAGIEAYLEGASIYVGELEDTGYLALINRQHPISAEPDLLVPMKMT